MNLEEIENALRPVNDLWNGQHGAGTTRFRDPTVPHIQKLAGYGWREDATGLVVSPFANNSEDLAGMTKPFTLISGRTNCSSLSGDRQKLTQRLPAG